MKAPMMKLVRVGAQVGALALGPALGLRTPPPMVHAISRVEAVRRVPRGLDLYMPVPDDNEMNSLKISLGRRLFFDNQLSKDSSMSCSTCHAPSRAFTDGRMIARGVDAHSGRRNVPTIMNRGYGSAFSWDGGQTSLEAQVLRPMSNPGELGLEPTGVVHRLSRNRMYAADFQLAFGRSVTPADLARALASFVRSIVSGDSLVDRYRDGDRNALTEPAALGLRVFLGKGNCWMCHAGPNFSDEKFHDTGVAWDGGGYRDEGRGGVTGNPADRGAFKTPTLRNVARTGPYMHDGSINTLEEAVEFYSRGARSNPNLDPAVEPLHLTSQEKAGLVALLQALSGRDDN